MSSRCVARWCIRCCRSQCIHTQHLRIIYGRQQANVNTQIYMRIYVCTIQWASHGMISLRSPLAFISCPSFQMSCCFRFPMRFPAISKPMSSTYQTRLVCNKFQKFAIQIREYMEYEWNRVLSTRLLLFHSSILCCVFSALFPIEMPMLLFHFRFNCD